MRRRGREARLADRLRAHLTAAQTALAAFVRESAVVVLFDEARQLSLAEAVDRALDEKEASHWERMFTILVILQGTLQAMEEREQEKSEERERRDDDENS